jgi:hypothetical protein
VPKRPQAGAEGLSEQARTILGMPRAPFATRGWSEKLSAVFVQPFGHIEMMLERRQGRRRPGLQVGVVALVAVVLEKRDGVLVSADLIAEIVASKCVAAWGF